MLPKRRGGWLCSLRCQMWQPFRLANCRSGSHQGAFWSERISVRVATGSCMEALLSIASQESRGEQLDLHDGWEERERSRNRFEIIQVVLAAARRSPPRSATPGPSVPCGGFATSCHADQRTCERLSAEAMGSCTSARTLCPLWSARVSPGDHRGFPLRAGQPPQPGQQPFSRPGHQERVADPPAGPHRMWQPCDDGRCHQ